MKQNQFSCYFIGDDSLQIELAEILLTKGHILLGFVTTNLQVRNWAAHHHVKYFTNLESLVDILVNNPPDYVFSFVNNKVIPSSILKHVRYLAINYHNALLPKYSGNHATSWAILNNEKQHGITWHVMTDLIDGGDILKQVTVPVTPKDTTISLDLKCLRKAIETFPELIEELAHKNYSLIKQTKKERDYYTLHQKPSGNGLIDWSLSAKEIDCLCRALNFSLYTNRLALPKFIIEDDIYVIQKVKIIASASSAPFGTIIQLSNRHLCIATTKDSIKLSHVQDMEGHQYSINDLIKKHKLKVGHRLPSYSDWRKELEETSSQLSKNESYWVKKLCSDSPVFLPFSHLEKSYSETKKGFISYKFRLPTNQYVKKFPTLEPKIVLLTILFIYFHRINNYQVGTIAISDQSFLNKIVSKELTNFFASYLPYSMHLQPETQFDDAAKQIIEDLESQREKKTYSQDIVIRYPSLRERNNRSPIAITLLNSRNEFIPSNNYLINFLITNDGNHLSMFVKNNLMLQEKDKAFVNNMKLSIQCLLNTIIENRYRPVKYLPLLTKDDYEKILIKWNSGKTDYQQNNTLHELIEVQAKKNPNHYAVIYEKSCLTYAALNDKANHLAAYLRKKGVNKEEPVLLCMTNSVELIIGLLGILKAGCAYVPVDYNYNKAFVQYIIKDAGSRIIITNSKLLPTIEQCLSTDPKPELILLDTQWDIIAQEKVQDLPNGNNTALAYILYTSGSTGYPKGCLVEHRSVINLLNDFQQKVPLASNDIATFWTSIGFDVSIYEIFSPLVSGATLRLFDREIISLDPYQYFKKLQSYQITSAYIPPFMLDKLLEWVKDSKNLLALKRLLVGVEPISENLLIEIQNHIPNVSIINGYGPTETTICSTLYMVKDYKIKEKRMVPIGKPVANTQIYI